MVLLAKWYGFLNGATGIILLAGTSGQLNAAKLNGALLNGASLNNIIMFSMMLAASNSNQCVALYCLREQISGKKSNREKKNVHSFSAK